MFASVTNTMKNKKLVRLLGLLVQAATVVPAGATAPVGFALIDKKDADLMVQSEPTFVSINPNVAPDADGKVQVAALPAGIAAFNATQASAAAAPAAGASQPATATTFTIDKNVQMPVVQRGGGKRESKYPFASLELPEGQAFGDSFFVASTPTKFASTLSGQNRKYKGSRKFALRAVTENGVSGVRVWRIALPAKPAA